MANQNDSFIDEVTDELRRDRLYGAMRRYGWIVVLLIVVAVGYTAWREYSVARDRAAAQDWGDAVLAAEAEGDAAAILGVDAQGSAERQAVRRASSATNASTSSSWVSKLHIQRTSLRAASQS